MLGAAAAATALAVVAAPAQAALECGDEIHVSRTLQRDLECDGTGIGLNIEGDDITLLNGHTISAEPNAAPSTGVFVGHGHGNVVTGGKIRGFDVGAAAGESSGAAIKHLDVKATVTQITVSESAATRVVENLLRRGSSSAILVDGQFTTDVKILRNEAEGRPLRIQDGANLVVRGNDVSKSEDSGILVGGSVDGVDIHGNHVDGADEGGIAIQGAADVDVVDNKVERAKGGGILSSAGAEGVTVRSNTVLDVNFNGFFVAAGTDVTLRRNVARRSLGGDGIHVEDADTLIDDNEVTNNDQHGIESTSANGSGNIARRNGVHPQCTPESLCG